MVSPSAIIAYNTILEKTNEQLGLWYNPYSLMISILTALLTAGAIIAAVILYMQSQDYKNQRKEVFQQMKTQQDEFLNEYRTKHDAFWQDLQKTNQKRSDELKKKMNAYEEAIKKSGEEATEKQNELEKLKKELDSSYQKWNKSKDFLEGAASASGSLVTYEGGFDIGRVHKCSICGFGFKVGLRGAGYSIFGTDEYKCPKCGNIDTF